MAEGITIDIFTGAFVDLILEAFRYVVSFFHSYNLPPARNKSCLHMDFEHQAKEAQVYCSTPV